jgi:hypothetical protein
MRISSGFVPAGVCGLVLLACAEPTGLQISSGSPTTVLSEGLSPNRHQLVMLHGSGWGRVVFRQAEDGKARIFFITWLRELEPNTTYLLQQALDSVADGICTGGVTNPDEWLTLGVGTKPWPITINALGSFHGPLYRTLPRRLVGTTFDSHLRLIEEATQAVVQKSGCFQFQVNL